MHCVTLALYVILSVALGTADAQGSYTDTLLRGFSGLRNRRVNLKHNGLQQDLNPALNLAVQQQMRERAVINNHGHGLVSRHEFCAFTRPTACIPHDGCPANLINYDYWTFNNGQCLQTEVLRSHVQFIGHNPDYRNFYNSHDVCMSQCGSSQGLNPALNVAVRQDLKQRERFGLTQDLSGRNQFSIESSIRSGHEFCSFHRPAACIPYDGCPQNLINYGYWTFTNGQCMQTQILKTHVHFIGHNPEYRNFYTTQDACRSQCFDSVSPQHVAFNQVAPLNAGLQVCGLPRPSACIPYDGCPQNLINTNYWTFTNGLCMQTQILKTHVHFIGHNPEYRNFYSTQDACRSQCFDTISPHNAVFSQVGQLNAGLQVCGLPRPTSCIPWDGCPSNLIDNHYWTFNNGRCLQTQVLNSHVRFIGQSAEYMNFYNTQDACMSQCLPAVTSRHMAANQVRQHNAGLNVNTVNTLEAGVVSGICSLPRPSACIPPTGYSKSLINNNYWTFNNGQCHQTQILSSHVQFIGLNPNYRNFFNNQEACRSQCFDTVSPRSAAFKQVGLLNTGLQVCGLPRPAACIPYDGCPQNLINNNYWTFNNGHCQQTQILNSHVQFIGQNPDYRNLYNTQDACRSQCFDTVSQHHVSFNQVVPFNAGLQVCGLPRPAACIPYDGCPQNLINNNYWTFNNGQCHQTQILNSHIQFIGHNPDYRNFYNTQDACRSQCLHSVPSHIVALNHVNQLNSGLQVCGLTRPTACIPWEGCPSNLINNNFWSFQNGQCQQIQILSSFVQRIGQDPLYGNFYNTQEACMSTCVPAFQSSHRGNNQVIITGNRVHSRLDMCTLNRPKACIPPKGCSKSLINNNFWTFNNGACHQTQILSSHVKFIGNNPNYRNFYDSRDVCMSQCAHPVVVSQANRIPVLGAPIPSGLGICSLPRPNACIPPQGYSNNLINSNYWTFNNGQCLQTQILNSHVHFIGHNPNYRNFYNTHDACLSQCGSPLQISNHGDRFGSPTSHRINAVGLAQVTGVRNSNFRQVAGVRNSNLRQVAGIRSSNFRRADCCYLPRPSACVPWTGCPADLIDAHYWTFNFNNGQCERTQILRSFVDQIGRNADYNNFYASHGACLSKCDI